MKLTFSDRIVCCYLYPITKYGYPPAAADTIMHIGEMKALGFRSIELEGIRERHLLEVYSIRHRIKNYLDKEEIKVPYFCVVLPGLSSADAELRRQNLQLFRRGCEIAQLFGARGVIDNAPLPPYQFPLDIPLLRHYEGPSIERAGLPRGLNWKQYWKDLIHTYRQACDIAANYDLSYQMHPAMGVLAANTDGFLYFAESVNRPNLRFNFDCANLFVLKENLPLALIRLIDHIDYIHLSDNRGQKTEHLAMGTGHIPWSSFFETLTAQQYHGYFGIDIGGSESEVPELDEAYRAAARWLEEQWFGNKE